MRGHRDLRLVTALAVLSAVVCLLAPLQALRLVFAVPLALALPGYAIAAAAFARRPLDPPRLGVVSLACGLAVLALGALPLNYVPGGIRPLSWALLLLAVTLGGCLVGAARRPPAIPTRAWRPPRLSAASAALLLAGFLAAGAAVALAQKTLPADNVLGYSELWALPEGGAEARGVKVGVGNQEHNAVAYDLLVRIGQRPLVRRSFALDPGEQRVFRLGRKGEMPNRDVPVVATLLRQDQTNKVYRRVQTWLPPRERR